MKRFIPHVHRARPLNGFENSQNLAENTTENKIRRTGLGPVRKTYRQMGLRNGISLGIRKKHIRIGDELDCVEVVTREEA